MKKTMIFILMFITGLLTTFFIGRKTADVLNPVIMTQADTIVICDTIRFTDTVTVREPLFAEEYVSGEISLSAATHQIEESSTDSLKLTLPMMSRRYENEDFELWVSGIEPRLDSIRIFWHEEQIISHKEVVLREMGKTSSRWSFGIMAGVGITGGRAGPFIGVGVSYRLF